MANNYTATAILASIKRRGFIPRDSTSFTTADLLSILSEELRTYITALLKSVNEEYLVTTETLTYAANQTGIELPSRAVSQGLRTIALVTDANQRPVPLERVEPERVHRYELSGSPVGYKLEGNQVQLIPRPAAAGSISVSYARRLSEVVAADACGEITSIDTNTNEVTCSGGLPATFTSSVTYDLVKGTPGFECRAIDQAATVAGNVVTFTELPDGLAVGDFVALAGESPIPQVPVEVHPLLAARVVSVALQAMGDATKLQAAVALLADRRAEAVSLLTPRVKASARPIINYGGPGWGGRGRRGR